MSEHAPLRSRVARWVSSWLVALYPRGSAFDASEGRAFLEEAARDASRERGWLGVLGLAATIGRDVVRARFGRLEVSITDERASSRPSVRSHARSSPMDRLGHDLQYAVRRLARTPGFTSVALLTLALGIGMTTAVFTVVNGSMLRPFPYPDMNRIVLLREADQSGQTLSVSWPNFEDWLAQGHVFQELGIYRGATVTLTGSELPERLSGSTVSASVFATMGVPPMLGRAFGTGDDRPGADRVAVISERLWRGHFGAASDIIGRAVTLNGQPFTVVGVMPAAMRFPSRLTDVWLPLGLIVDTFPKDRGNHPGLTAIGRLASDVTLDRARAAMATIAERLSAAYPDSNHNSRIVITPYYETVVQAIRPAFQLLFGAVGLVLLIACANLANLMLARADARQRELAIRAALGASRRRLVQALLVEACVLSGLGGLLGVCLAYWAVAAFVGSHPTTIPRVDLIRVDARVLLFALAVSMLTGLLFGAAPALRGSLVDLQQTLRTGRDGFTPGARRLRQILVSTEIALALVLLVGAGLLGKSLIHLMSVDLGFNPSHVVTMQVTLPPASYPTQDKWTAFHRTLLTRLASVPGVDGFGISSNLPLSGNGTESAVMKEGDPPPTPEHPPAECLFQSASPDYFRAMGIALVRGRVFDDHDTTSSTPVAMVDDTLVARLFPDRDPIGRRIAFEFEGHSAADFRPIYREIVGVVRHVKHYALTSEPPNVQVFTPYTQLPLWMQERRPGMGLVVRTASDSGTIVAAVRDAVRSVDPTIPVFGVQTMDETIHQTMEQPRLSLALFAAFAGLALALAVVGVYGVLSYAVAQRTPEIGVRMALGARRGQIARLVARQATVLVGVGLAVGIVGALALSRLLTSLLVDVSPTDPLTFAGVVAVLAGTAGVASAIPARRASGVDPLVALRRE
jgi:putative ABC transport system permease protein